MDSYLQCMVQYLSKYLSISSEIYFPYKFTTLHLEASLTIHNKSYEFVHFSLCVDVRACGCVCISEFICVGVYRKISYVVVFQGLLKIVAFSFQRVLSFKVYFGNIATYSYVLDRC